MPCPFHVLVITDGTTDDAGIRNEVDLLSPGGFCLLEEGDWRPAITEPKGGGVWKDSALTDGRRPADFKAQNVVETMTLTVTALDQDQLIRDTQELRRLLTKARTYGTTDWQTEPVWIEAQGNGETNMRYAIVWNWGTPNDGNPYEAPFWQQLPKAGMDDFTLTLEREPYWRANQPGSSTCVEIAGYGEYCLVTPLLFPAANAVVNCGNPPGLQNLPDFAVSGKGPLVVDGWVRADSLGESNAGEIVCKPGAAGWELRCSATGLYGFVNCTTNAWAGSGLDEFSADGEWHHVMMAYDETGGITPVARTIYLAIDGAWVTSYSPPQQASVGPYAGDGGVNMYIGALGFGGGGFQTFDGDIGWLRVGDAMPTGITVGVNFTTAVPLRCPRPRVLTSTQGQYIWEGTGATTGNEGAAGGAGTITGATWDADEACCITFGSVDDTETVDPTCEE